jgi:hypothetical protein
LKNTLCVFKIHVIKLKTQNDILFLSNPDYEDIGIKTILITAVISLSVVIRYLYKQHAKELKEKDEAHTKSIKREGRGA